jgi:arsenate reductase
MAKKSILFVCIGNCCRSQMAEGFASKLSGDKYEIYSAGSRPAGFVHPDAIAVMKEIGIDISSQYSKGVGQVPAKDIDYFIAMGCGDTCPVVSAKNRIEWDIEDPIGKDIEFFRKTRDVIGSKVDKLLKSLE